MPNRARPDVALPSLLRSPASSQLFAKTLETDNDQDTTTMAPVASPSNPYKRQIDAIQRVYDCTKRLKTAHESGESAPSTVSDESALASTSVPEDATEASEVESDDESWVSESSEEPSDESDVEESEDEEDENEDEEDADHDDDTVVNLRANRGERPSYKLHEDEELEDIRPFLKDFIPQLKAANEELEAQKRSGTLQTSEIVGEEDGEGEEQYIEMVSSWLPLACTLAIENVHRYLLLLGS